jgi:hypothetical protein
VCFRSPLLPLIVRRRGFGAHDPEKWLPVSRLREAMIIVFSSVGASAGEGRSDKIMRK